MNDDPTVGLHPGHARGQPKKRRLSVAEKTQIFQFYKDNPLVTHTNIAAKFGVERSTVSKIVHQTHYAAAHENGGSAWKPQSTPILTENASRVESQLMEWAQDARRLGINVTRDMIRAQAAILANKMQPQLVQPVSTTSMLETPTFTSAFNPGSASALASFPDQAYNGGSSLTESDLDLLARSCDLMAIQEEESLHGTADPITASPYCTTMQSDSLYNTPNHSCLFDPGLTLDMVSYSSPMYDKATCHIPTCTKTHNKLTDAVCLSEARRAFDTVESYVTNSQPAMALDQLCLNHIKACLY
ncbi:hypothetical protein J1614_001949 [Plenodomus biglobosus]|nr:hypothetical protein J1614_001949 [Plenodomus biglobosus]